MFENKRNIEALWQAVDRIHEHFLESDKVQEQIVNFLEHTSERVSGIEADIYGEANYIVVYTLSKTQNYEVFSSYHDAFRRLKEVKGFEGVESVYISEIIDRGEHEVM